MKEYTLSGRQANGYGLLFVVPVLLVAVIPYIIIWYDRGFDWPNNLLAILSRNEETIRWAIAAKWWLVLLLLAGIVLHELIHGVCMAATARNGWKSVSFGFNAKVIALFAHCKEPLRPFAYRFSLVAPGFLLGDVPILISWFTGNILFLFFGVLFCWAASGDVVVLWMSRHISGGMIQDHPDKIGLIHIQNSD